MLPSYGLGPLLVASLVSLAVQLFLAGGALALTGAGWSAVMFVLAQGLR